MTDQLKTDHLQKYMEYIDNTGGSPKVEWFDEDWEPIGPMLRKDMADANLIYESGGLLYKTGTGPGK